MTKWGIVTDSGCDLIPTPDRYGEVLYSSVPFIISAGDTFFKDDEDLDVPAMLDAIERCEKASHTACPSPQSWIERFEQAEQSIAITISSAMSGAMNSAMLARDMVLEKYPGKKIAVIDSRSAGPEMVLCVEQLLRDIEAHIDFDKIVERADAFFDKAHIIFALSSFDNLVKAGRMNKIAGFLARKLGLWGVGVGSDAGLIEIKGKAKGAARALKIIIEDMKEHGFSGGKVVISHCQNLDFAERVKNAISEQWSRCDIRILPTRGLTSFYAERNGLILSYCD